jgi:hypothetical protein
MFFFLRKKSLTHHMRFTVFGIFIHKTFVRAYTQLIGSIDISFAGVKNETTKKEFKLYGRLCLGVMNSLINFAVDLSKC